MDLLTPRGVWRSLHTRGMCVGPGLFCVVPFEACPRAGPLARADARAHFGDAGAVADAFPAADARADAHVVRR